jgi:hypothetical protein
MELKKKNKSIKKMIKKQQLKELGPIFTWKVNKNKCSRMELKKKNSIKKMIQK